MDTFQLGGTPFITLNNLLKIMRWVGTGGEANIGIENGHVTLNGTTELQKRKKIRPGDVVVFGNNKVKIEL